MHCLPADLVSVLRGRIGTSSPTTAPSAPSQQSIPASERGQIGANAEADDKGSFEEAQALFNTMKTMPSEKAYLGANGQKRTILMKERFKCHRAAPDRKSQAAPTTVLKKVVTGKKDAKCPYVEEWIVFEDEPDMLYIFPLHGHMGHTPGDKEDMYHLKLDSELEAEVERVSALRKSSASCTFMAMPFQQRCFMI